MIRFDVDWTERREVRLARTAIIHGNTKESGDAECFAVWLNLLKVPPKGFFPLVNAAGNLKEQRR